MTVYEYSVELIYSICSPRRILNKNEKEGKGGKKKEGREKKRNGRMRDKEIEERQGARCQNNTYSTEAVGTNECVSYVLGNVSCIVNTTNQCIVDGQW